MANNKVITYDDFIERYNALVKRSEELSEALGKIKFSLKPDSVKKRKELKELLADVNSKLDDLEGFAMEACIYDNKTLVNFMTKFYSYYYKKNLKVIEIYDNKFSKYAEHAYLIVTAEDYKTLTSNFNFDKPVNSDKVVKKCKNQEFLYLSGKKKAQLLNGLTLSEEFEQFPEIEEVLHTAIAYKLNNRDLQNKVCLELALDDYINRHNNVVSGPDLLNNTRYQPLATDVAADISRNVQQIMDEDKTVNRQNSAPRQTSGHVAQQVVTPQNRGQQVQTGATQRRDAVSVAVDMLYMLDNMYKMEEAMGDKVVEQPRQTAAQPVQQQTQQPVQQQTQQPAQQPVQPVQPVQQTVQVPTGDMSGDLHQTRPVTSVRVTGQEEAPQAKVNQYKAGSSVLLDMLDNMLSLDDEDPKRLKK